MLTTFRKHKSALIAAGVTALVIGGGAYAAIPAADGTITACYDPADPALRVLDTATATACPANQKMIAFNQKGQRGPTGPVGMKGMPGPAYFVRVGANDNDTNRSTVRTTIRTWNYGDIIWIYLPNLDTNTCAVTANGIYSNAANVSVTRLDANYANWIGLYTNVNGQRARMAVDAIIACPEY